MSGADGGADAGESGGPWPSRTNCVDDADGVETAERETLPVDRVEEFCEEYPELAYRPVTEEHGRSLRREATEATHEPEYVEPARATENGFVTYRLREREAARWCDVLFAFLDAHQRYEDGMQVRFEGLDETGAEMEFTVDLYDSWGETYARREYARAMAMERQLAGGEHPDGTEVEGKWSELMTVMLTFTGTSVPGGDRLAPVDQFDPVSDSWSYGGDGVGAVRDTVRNIVEKELGLESDEWGYLRFGEPHGVGAAQSDGEPGANACYSHTHVGIYLDVSMDEVELKEAFHKAIDKHLEACELAEFSAHDYFADDPDERPISVNGDVANMGSYLTAYLSAFSSMEPDDDEERPEYVPLIERPIEYVAWGSVMWSMNRQRIGRSKVLNEAIAADQCMAKFRDDDDPQHVDHGEHLTRSSTGYGSDVECVHCGSGWDVPDADTITEARLVADGGELEDDRDDDRDDDREAFQEERGGADPDHSWARASQPLRDTEVLSKIERYVRVNGDDVTAPEVVGALDLHQDQIHMVEEVLTGETPEVEIEGYERPEYLDYGEWEVVAFIDPDGEEHCPSADGGVDMVETYLPVTCLLEETRLKYIGSEGNPKIRCKKTGFATYSAETMARYIVDKCGVEKPEYAEALIAFEDPGSNGIPTVYDEPVSEPPSSSA